MNRFHLGCISFLAVLALACTTLPAVVAVLALACATLPAVVDDVIDAADDVIDSVGDIRDELIAWRAALEAGELYDVDPLVLEWLERKGWLDPVDDAVTWLEDRLRAIRIALEFFDLLQEQRGWRLEVGDRIEFAGAEGAARAAPERARLRATVERAAGEG